MSFALRRTAAHAFILFAIAGVAASCSTDNAGSGGGSTASSALTKPDPAALATPAPDSFRVAVETSKGNFTILVHRDWAPQGADRFYHLVRLGYFDDVRFFRVLKGFMAQFGVHGDPRVNAAWEGMTLQDDPVKQSNKRGMVTFAQTSQPNSRGTQLFINYADNSNLDAMGFAPIENSIRDFGERARKGALQMEELTGGTFTITNGGIFGSMMSTPILNPPQSGILGMHKIQQRPMVIDGKIEARPMMYLALTYDHRIVDGREAVQFLVHVKDILEDPARFVPVERVQVLEVEAVRAHAPGRELRRGLADHARRGAPADQRDLGVLGAFEGGRGETRADQLHLAHALLVHLPADGRVRVLVADQDALLVVVFGGRHVHAAHLAGTGPRRDARGRLQL